MEHSTLNYIAWRTPALAYGADLYCWRESVCIPSEYSDVPLGATQYADY